MKNSKGGSGMKNMIIGFLIGVSMFLIIGAGYSDYDLQNIKRALNEIASNTRSIDEVADNIKDVARAIKNK